jgi:NAD(P)-dependent dehydrogenase (short-subunit alcohol dehydrogenase family)
MTLFYVETNITEKTSSLLTTSDYNTMAAKIVLVTGANSGIGYETVKTFLQSPNSYHVYLGSRSLENGKKAFEKIQGETSSATNTVELLQIDLSSDESIEKAFEVVKKGPGRLDVLINNAGKHVVPNLRCFVAKIS